jgi:hypothetical protein
MPKKPRRAPRLHSLEIERHELDDGRTVEIESSIVSDDGFVGLCITVDLPDEPEDTNGPEPAVLPPEDR